MKNNISMGEMTDEQIIESDGTTQEDETEPIGLHGMSDTTVRVVIDQHASQNIGEAYNIDGIKDKGRYYIVKLVRTDGRIIDRLLIDKQSGTVSSLKSRI